MRYITQENRDLAEFTIQASPDRYVVLESARLVRGIGIPSQPGETVRNYSLVYGNAVAGSKLLANVFGKPVNACVAGQLFCVRGVADCELETATANRSL